MQKGTKITPIVTGFGYVSGMLFAGRKSMDVMLVFRTIGDASECAYVFDETGVTEPPGMTTFDRR